MFTKFMNNDELIKEVIADRIEMEVFFRSQLFISSPFVKSFKRKLKSVNPLKRNKYYQSSEITFTSKRHNKWIIKLDIFKAGYSWSAYSKFHTVDGVGAIHANDNNVTKYSAHFFKRYRERHLNNIRVPPITL